MSRNRKQQRKRANKWSIFENHFGTVFYILPGYPAVRSKLHINTHIRSGKTAIVNRSEVGIDPYV